MSTRAGRGYVVDLMPENNPFMLSVSKHVAFTKRTSPFDKLRVRHLIGVVTHA